MVGNWGRAMPSTQNLLAQVWSLGAELSEFDAVGAGTHSVVGRKLTDQSWVDSFLNVGRRIIHFAHIAGLI